MLTVVATPMKAKAEQKPYMEQLNISWDLEPDHTVTYQSYYYAVGFKDHKATIKDFKIENAEKKGYRKLTFTAEFNPDPNFTDDEFIKITNEWINNYINDSDKNYILNYQCGIVDYNTGENLKCSNDKNVTVKIGKPEMSEPKKYERSGHSWEVYQNIKENISIIYPNDYNNLCIVLGGSAVGGNTDGNKKFASGDCKFSDTSFFSAENKEVAHAMRIAGLSTPGEEIELDKNPTLLLVGQKLYISLKDWTEHEEWKIVNAESSNKSVIKTSASYSEMEGMGSSAELEGLKEGAASVVVTARSFTSGEEKVFTCNIKVEKETAQLDRMRFNVKNSKNGVIIYGVTAIDKKGKRYNLKNLKIDTIKNKKLKDNKFEIKKKELSDLDDMERNKMDKNIKNAEKWIPLVFSFSHGNSKYTTGLARVYLDKKGRVVGKFENAAVFNEAF